MRPETGELCDPFLERLGVAETGFGLKRVTRPVRP
jgi:hypothetical protein